MNKQYIKYNIGDYDGCGVIVENYFITAGHNFNYGDFIFQHGDKTIKLSKNDAIYFAVNDQTPPDSKGYDIAICKLDGIESKLRMSKLTVNKGDILKSVSYYHLGGDNECFEEIESVATVEKVEGNYFLCSMERTLLEGSSGSPIFDSNGNISGILCAEDYENGRCAFISSISIDRFLFQYFEQELCNKIDLVELLQQTEPKLTSIAMEYLRQTSFSIAPSEEDMIKYPPLNVREIFICLTQMKISESLLHDCVMQIDCTGIYYDEIYSAISRADYKRFKEVLQSKNCTLNKVSLILQNYLVCGLNFRDTQTSDCVDLIQDISPNNSIMLNWMISSGFFSQDEIELINYLDSKTTNKNEEINTYSLSQYEILNSHLTIISKILAKQFIIIQQLEGLTKTKQFQELFSNPFLKNLNDSVGYTNDEYQRIVSISSNVDMLDMLKNVTYLLGRTIIAKLDEQFTETEASQCETNNALTDNGSTEKASPFIDYREIFVSQAPNVDYKTMRAIAVKLAAKENNMNTGSQSAYILPIDVARFCYFFLHEINVPDCIDKVDFSYPIQWLGGWESLKYFIIKLYELKSLPSNLGEEVVEAFRFKLKRQRSSEKGKISEKTFNNSKNIISIVDDEDRKRINSILREFNL